MRDYSKDESATIAAYQSGYFVDKKKRSWIDNLGHIHTRGKDRSFQRRCLFLHVKGLCETCGRYRDEQHGDMDHDGKTPRTRCECLVRTLNDGVTTCTGIHWRCGFIVPNSCHRKRHNREPQFGASRKGVEA